MRNESEKAVLAFFKKIDFPGIRQGEENIEICNYLKSQGYNSTPDLVAGPKNIKDARVEGLFFIDVIQPTSDLLFKSKASHQLNKIISHEMIDLFNKNTKNNVDTLIETFPTEHHQLYLNVINKKLKKYSHKRAFKKDNKSLVSANLGIVHHFNLGDIQHNTISNTKELITLVDYISFYKHLAPHDNIDLTNASTLLWEEIIKPKPGTPYILVVAREWSDLPYWFLLIHVNIVRNGTKHDFAIMLINTCIANNLNSNYPVYKWLISQALHPSTQEFEDDKIIPTKTTFHVHGSNDLFK